MTSSSPSLLLRREVIGIYKELLNLGRSYPLGYTYFRTRLHRAFMSNAHVQSVEEIRRGVERAEFVRKEIEALYYLKRYRALRQRYKEG
ncbi:hypothetical protein BCIN_08g00530 [Botrytis cinerea B05.10]|uniref:Uncharacterized protein n=2 Tax=Botryotinia fuckeliana TaxID=40559 RepID=A0A384JNY4_BOTFB|nr:hypothetical protein BCIN_08g00530 [Botrytis cinerea B05.10]ATZ52296.1 hypothetical protein BCIN_08g00530 [Botrytis cinerea B05.10]EMR85457.1 putative lyr family protein [Botrytis cinerea BcDW1]